MELVGIQDANAEEMEIAEKKNLHSLDDVRNYMRYGTTDIVQIQKMLGVDRKKVLDKFEKMNYN